MAFLHVYPLMDDYLTQRSIDSPRTLRLWTWDDSSRIANFMKMHHMRCQKYGTEIGVQVNRDLTKEEIKQKEDALTAFFLHEMRKAPVSA